MTHPNSLRINIYSCSNAVPKTLRPLFAYDASANLQSAAIVASLLLFLDPSALWQRSRGAPPFRVMLTAVQMHSPILGCSVRQPEVRTAVSMIGYRQWVVLRPGTSRPHRVRHRGPSVILPRDKRCEPFWTSARCDLGGRPSFAEEIS